MLFQEKYSITHVEFYNNSSCREMFISVEGMPPDAKFLTNE